MNDSTLQADLRNYFQAVAAERPRDGELARAVAATGRIRPKAPWEVQLEVLLRPLRLPTQAGLRAAVLLALLLLALALLAIGAAIASRPPAAATPFEGRWVAIDIADGSDMVLVVSEGKKPSVRYEDVYASACFNNGDRSTHWISKGSATIVGNAMSVFYQDGGGCTTWHIDPYVDAFTLDLASKTFTDTYGNTWHRPTP